MTTSTHKPLVVWPAREAAAGTLALLGALSGAPLALALLDFAGLIDVFAIETDAPRGLLVLAGIGGCLTLATITVAFAGAVLAFTGAALARPLLLVAAMAGFPTALMLWLPSAIVLVAAASLLAREDGQ